MLKSTFALLSVLFSMNVHASDEIRVYRDSNNMPRCIEGKVKYGARQSVLLRWEETDRYERFVEAFLLEESFVPRNEVQWFGGQLRCSDWKSLSRIDLMGESTEVGKHTSTLFGIELNEELKSAVTQISMGGNVFRSTSEPASFFSEFAKPGTYALEDNRALTRRYGAAFSAEIYRAWINAQPGNRELALDLFWKIRKDSVHGRLAPDVRILVVDGFSGGLRRIEDVPAEERASGGVSPALMGDLLDDLVSLGFNTQGIKTKPYARLDHNTPIVEQALQDSLNEGKRVIFVSLSRGVAETLGAIAAVRAKARTQGLPDQYEDRIALINLSGLVKGSVIADFVRNRSLLWWIGHMIQRLTGRSEDGNTILGAGDLTLQHVSRRYDALLPDLPQNMAVWNLTGIVPKFNSRFRDLRPAWEAFSRNHQPSSGAHDGFIEYPLTELPRADFPRARTLSLDSTHFLVDGEFMTYDLSETEIRRRVLRTIILEFARESSFL